MSKDTPQQHRQKHSIKLIKQLANKVANHINDESHTGLLSGTSGQLLFLLLTENNLPGTVDHQLLQQQIERLQTSLQTTNFNPGLTSGLCGIGLAFEFIQQALGESDDINQQLDLSLLKIMSQPVWQGEYELLQGLSGFILYALHRLDHPTGQQVLDKAMQQLLALKTDQPDGIAWATRNESPFKLNHSLQTEFNLSLAHGNIGVLGVLTQVYQRQPTDELKAIIQQLSHWLLKQGSFNGQDSYFGSYAGDANSARLGWCYGDLMNSLMLWHSGKALNDSNMMTQAKEIALLAAQYPLAESRVADAGLCHGGLGIALILDTLHQHMQDETLKMSADRWFDLSLNAVQTDDQTDETLQGFWYYNPIEGKKVECFGFLEGYAGMGMALFAPAGFDTDWKQCLLIR